MHRILWLYTYISSMYKTPFDLYNLVKPKHIGCDYFGYSFFIEVVKTCG